MVVDGVVGESGLCVRRRKQRGNTEPCLAEVVVEVGAGMVVGEHGRANVVEEPTPLVVGDDEQASLPMRRLDEGPEDLLEKALPETGVTPGVVVGPVLEAELRVPACVPATSRCGCTRD